MSDSSNYDLEHLQRWMQSVITHYGGIEAGIDSAEARSVIDVSPDEVEHVISRSQACTSIERLNVYGNAYYARLLQCMRDSFPCLLHAVGQEVFDEFMFGYLQSFPPTSYTLADLGNNFASYLEETKPSTAGDTDWPDFLIDLATLEWNIEQVFDGPGLEGKPQLDAEQISKIPAEQWPLVRLRSAPSLRLLRFRFPVNSYYTQFRKNEQSSFPQAQVECVALNRRRFIVRRHEIPIVQFPLLQRLVSGEPLGVAIEIVAEADDWDIEALAVSLQQWFHDWTEAGFFEAVNMP